MKRSWILRVGDETTKGGGSGIYLGVKETKSEQAVHLIGPCETLDDFQREISHLIDELNQLSTEAREKIELLERESEAGREMIPDEVWRQMEACGTEAEMFDLFNSFGEKQRQELAEYVFTHVNMFKGRGPIFSEHYDSASHFLE